MNVGTYRFQRAMDIHREAVPLIVEYLWRVQGTGPDVPDPEWLELPRWYRLKRWLRRKLIDIKYWWRYGPEPKRGTYEYYSSSYDNIMCDVTNDNACHGLSSLDDEMLPCTCDAMRQYVIDRLTNFDYICGSTAEYADQVTCAMLDYIHEEAVWITHANMA